LFLAGSERLGWERERAGEKGRGRGEGGRNDANIVCTYE
jgi:hypothetical protein